jgi:hypothetical protein
MSEADWSPSDEADIRSLSGESPVARAPAGGESQRVGWFRLYFDDERWEWSPEVERMHGYEPGTVQPTTALVLSHKHPVIASSRSPSLLLTPERAIPPPSVRFRIFNVEVQLRAAGSSQ